MTGISLRNTFEIVLGLVLGFPEIADWHDFGDTRYSSDSLAIAASVFL
jgi:hypothetical protein